MFFGPDFITVTKVSIKCTVSLLFCCAYGYQITQLLLFRQTDEDVDWTGIKHHVSEAIAKFFESGDPITTGVVYNESSAYAIIHIGHLCGMQFFFFWINPQLICL